MVVDYLVESMGRGKEQNRRCGGEFRSASGKTAQAVGLSSREEFDGVKATACENQSSSSSPVGKPASLSWGDVLAFQ